jgi:hypothetical protein
VHHCCWSAAEPLAARLRRRLLIRITRLRGVKRRAKIMSLFDRPTTTVQGITPVTLSGNGGYKTSAESTILYGDHTIEGQWMEKRDDHAR